MEQKITLANKISLVVLVLAIIWLGRLASIDRSHYSYLMAENDCLENDVLCINVPTNIYGQAVEGIDTQENNPAHYLDTDLVHFGFEYPGSLLGKDIIVSFKHLDLAKRKIDLGARRGSFWLDYEKYELSTGSDWQFHEIKFASENLYRKEDGTLSFMLFAEGIEEDNEFYLIRDLKVSVQPRLINQDDLSKYIKRQAKIFLGKPI